MPDLKMGTVYGPLNWPVLFCFNRLLSRNNRLYQYFMAVLALFPLEQKTGPPDWQTEPDTGPVPPGRGLEKNPKGSSSAYLG